MAKKIAFITTMCGFPWGGSEYLWSTTAEKALKDGHEVLISLYDWSVNHPSVKNLQDQGARLFPRPRTQSSSLFSRFLRKSSHFIPSLKKLNSQAIYKPIFDSNPDIICISQGGMCDGIFSSDLLESLYSSSIPYIVICQLNIDTFSFDDLTRSIIQKQFAYASSVAFVAHNNLKLAERQLALDLSNAIVVQNPVNLFDHSSVGFPQRSTAMFASVARLETAYKGQDVLFEVLSTPEWKKRDWECKLYGSGPDAAYLEDLSKYYGISDRIQLAGQVSDIRSIWAENHLLVLPSRGEGTPLSLIEAMLCGRPAVVTDVGGNAEWIEESVTGFVAEASTARSLSLALERAWMAQDDWEQMGKRAHEYAINRLDPSPGNSLLKNIIDFAK
jgi:L-malate glycosyltransferase